MPRPSVHLARHIIPFLPMTATTTAYSARMSHRKEQAEHRIRPYVRQTALEHSPTLSAATGARVFLKLESGQVSGSFKARGAFNKLLSLTTAQRAAGIP